jgi:site-specific recombinase XerD
MLLEAETTSAENAEFSAAGRHCLVRAGCGVGMGQLIVFPRRNPRALPDAIPRAFPGAGDDELVEAFLAGLSPPTARAYRGDLACLADFLSSRGVSLAEAGPADLRAWAGWLRARGRAETTIRRRLAAASGLYRWLVGAGMLAASPTEGLPRPQSTPAPRLGPGNDELRRLLEVAHRRGRREELLARLLLCCGLRVAEALFLDASHVVPYEGRLLLEVRRKGGRRELVGVPEETARVLTEHLAGQGPGPILRSRGGRRLSARGAYAIVAGLGQEAGIAGLHPHLLRHAYVTQALWAGVALPAVAAGAGHRDVRTTIGYAQALCRAGAEAGEAVEQRLRS